MDLAAITLGPRNQNNYLALVHVMPDFAASNLPYVHLDDKRDYQRCGVDVYAILDLFLCSHTSVSYEFI